MSDFVCAVVSCLVNASWQIVLIGGAGWIASRFMKKLGPQAIHVLWVATLALAVVIPALPLCRWLLNVIHLSRAVAGSASIAVSAAQSGSPNAKGIAVLPEALILALFCLYLCSVFYFAVRLARSLYWTITLLRETHPILLEPGDEKLWDRCKRLMSVKDAAILSSRRISGPVTIGIRQPVLLLPEGFFEQCSSPDLLTALGHECVHIHRCDFQKNLFYEAASLIIAFHPVAWMLKSQIAQTREMICDALTVEKVIDSRSYTQSLLQLATMIVAAPQPSTSHAIGIFDGNILEKRIMHIKTKKQKLSWAARYGRTILAAMFLFSITASLPVMAIGVEAAKDGPQSQAYHVGGEVTAPQVVYAPDPDFPKSARKGKDTLEGIVVLKLIVDAAGNPGNVQVVRSLRRDFDQNAIKAVEQYRFTPALRSGQPVAVAVNIEVNFKRW
jgi:TonB family protein